MTPIKIIVGIGLVVAGFMFAISLPDIKRYIKMSTM